LARRTIVLPGHPSGKKPAAESNGRITIGTDPGETQGESLARIAMHPAVTNATTTRNYLAPSSGNLDHNARIEQIVTAFQALDKGGADAGREIEHRLLGQAVSLEAIFHEMARRAALNMGTFIEPTETYMRLALKAQAQCRATLETLAEIKNPRPVYINPGQVNHANGPQQVNNGLPARAPENAISQNKLLEGK
jgi:hypothetical protein